ncbi:MAG: bifunctional DNA-formamidopyrimidine glycosylase/DNA-(apurinic or apyrimidinic site) lyase [Acidobacteriota bacterium]
MPELPEVETILRGLKRDIVGESITCTACSGARIFRTDPSLIAELLPGQVIRFIQRRGKYLILRTSSNYLVIHLGMTGQLLLQKDTSVSTVCGEPDNPHVHMILHFRSRKALFYRDPRKFGRILFFKKKQELSHFFARLGLEPLSDNFTFAAFCRILQKKKGKIKPFLMNQSYVCGMGNIYADEVLFASSIHPETPIPALTDENRIKLHQAIPEVLSKGSDSGGTTFRDYRNSDGGEGGFQEMLNVYGREGLACRKCQSLIRRVQVGGRSSHYCSSCQRKS